MAFGVLAGGEGDEVDAGGEVDLAGEEGADFADADGFFAGFGEGAEGGDFIDDAGLEEGAGAFGDAGVESFAGEVDEYAAEVGGGGSGGGEPLVAEEGGGLAGELADFEGAAEVAAVFEVGAGGFDGIELAELCGEFVE